MQFIHSYEIKSMKGMREEMEASKVKKGIMRKNHSVMTEIQDKINTYVEIETGSTLISSESGAIYYRER